MKTKKVEKQCQEFDQKRLNEMLTQYPMLADFINENKDVASPQTVEYVQEVYCQKLEISDFDWITKYNNHWIGQLHGFDVGHIELDIEQYIVNTFGSCSGVDVVDLDDEDWDEIKSDIQSHIDTNCTTTEQLINILLVDYEQKKYYDDLEKEYDKNNEERN